MRVCGHVCNAKLRYFISTVVVCVEECILYVNFYNCLKFTHQISIVPVESDFCYPRPVKPLPLRLNHTRAIRTALLSTSSAGDDSVKQKNRFKTSQAHPPDTDKRLLQKASTHTQRRHTHEHSRHTMPAIQTQHKKHAHVSITVGRNWLACGRVGASTCVSVCDKHARRCRWTRWFIVCGCRRRVCTWMSCGERVRTQLQRTLRELYCFEFMSYRWLHSKGYELPRARCVLHHKSVYTLVRRQQNNTQATHISSNRLLSICRRADVLSHRLGGSVWPSSCGSVRHSIIHRIFSMQKSPATSIDSTAGAPQPMHI